ncbi:MAG: cytochrome c [Pseudomonadota bacterium]
MKRLSICLLGAFGLGLLMPALSAEPSGASLFAERCGMCHRSNGMGVGILARRPGDLSKGLLEDRTDLTVPLIMTVTRLGFNNMPRIPRGEVSEPEMQAIAEYLAKGNK